MPSIVPPTTPAQTCDSPHVDGCPECVRNTEPPRHVDQVPGGCVCEYICADCWHTWQTAWGCA